MPRSQTQTDLIDHQAKVDRALAKGPKLQFCVVDIHEEVIAAAFRTYTLAAVFRSHLVNLDAGNATRYSVSVKLN